MTENPQRIKVLGIPVDRLTMQQTLSIAEDAVKNKKQIHHTVINLDKMVNAQTDIGLYDSVAEADVINADGMGVLLAAKLTGKSLPERVTGVDLMRNLVELAGKENYTVYLFGAEETIVSKLSNQYKSQYGENIIAGYRNGYFDKSEEQEIAEQIAQAKPNFLFVAMPSPHKEIFLNKYKDILKDVNFIMGVGGSFDVFAGKVKRAPMWVQNAGLEKVYRFLQEPKRMWKRMAVNVPKYFLLIVKDWMNMIPGR